MSTLRQITKINAWRAQFNPLRGLTIQRAVTMLEEGERGAYADLQWAYRYIEKRDATLRALVARRTSAIRKLDWDIKLVSAATAKTATPAQRATAEAQAKALRAAYEKIANLREAVQFLALAEFRGFAHLEKRYEGDNPSAPVVRLEPVPQWHWCRDTIYGPWTYNADAAVGRVNGTPVDLAHFIVREVTAPINEIGLICYLRKNLSQKDWDGFVETYGIPSLFVTMPANVPADQEATYQAMAEAVVGDMRGTLPNGADVKTVGDGARGVNPFRDHLTYQDEQLVLAGTGGKLTMLNGPTGLGGGQSEAHADTFDEIAQAEAGEISEIFQRQFDRAVLDAAGFVGQPALAYFELAAVDQADVGQILDHAVKAAQAGLRVDPAELSEKTGLKLTAAPVAPVPALGGFGTAPARTVNRASPVDPDAEALRRATAERVRAALSAKLRPVLEALRAAAESDDDARFDAALAEAKTTLRAEAAKLNLSPDDPLVKAFAEGMGTAVVNGAATATEATTANRATGPLAWLRDLFTRR